MYAASNPKGDKIETKASIVLSSPECLKSICDVSGHVMSSE